MSQRGAVCVVGLILLVPGATRLAAAQTPVALAPSVDVAQARRPVVRAATPRRLDWRAYFTYDTNAMAAKETFDVIFEKTTFNATGFGGEVLNVWRGLFVRAAVSSIKETGSRAVVFDGEPVRLGIPLTLELRPIEIGAGWRLAPVGRGRVVPYGGLAFVRVGYTETSDFAGSGENTATAFSGLGFFGGVEVRVAPWIIAGVEAQVRSIDALGTGGVSKEFGETNLGGRTLRVLIGVRR
jgi:hypothetical protein